jgi:hypothetical protein
MTNEEKIQLILCVTGAIFQSKLGHTDITKVTITTNTGTFAGRTFVGGKLRGFDLTCRDANGIIPLRILEQNPDKEDGYGNLKQNAVLARAGHQIAWIIRTDTNKFLGKVQDGTWIKSTPRATTTVQYNSAIPGTGVSVPVTAQDQYDEDYTHYDDGNWQRELPDIDVNDIPLYVVGV